MYWKTNDQWPAYICECLVAYKVIDAEEYWTFERALPDPHKSVWHSLETNGRISSEVKYWVEIDDPN